MTQWPAVEFPWSSRPSGFCRRLWWSSRARAWSDRLVSWAHERVTPYSRYPTVDDVPTVRLGFAALLEASADGLDASACAALRASRFGVWVALDDWTSKSRGAMNLGMLNSVPVQFGHEVQVLARERRAQAKAWAFLSLYACLIALGTASFLSFPPSLGAVVGAALVVGALMLRFAVVAVSVRRLNGRVAKAMVLARERGPSSYEGLVFALWGPVGSWSVRNVERMLRSSSSLLESGEDLTAAWLVGQFDGFVRAAGLDSSARETFMVLLGDGFDGSLDELAEVARRL